MPPKPAKKSIPTAEPSRENQVHATALHHARLIQDQKDLQNHILDLIIEFLDLPSSSTADPAKPSADESSAFKNGLATFQQRDYDDLITERNIADKCGYALCPRPVKRENTTATDRIIWSKKKGSDLKIVPRAELEKWCSRECAERAVFVKAQLNESPAWVIGAKKEAIVLLDEVRAQKDPESSSSKGKAKAEPTADTPQTLVDGIRQLAIRDGLSAEDEEALRKIRELALERGRAARAGNRDEMGLVERKTTTIARPPKASAAGDAGSIEGYRPKQRATDDDDDDDDDDDGDIVHF